MMYTQEFFYSHRWNQESKIKNFQITSEDIQKIKSLKSHLSDESGYYDTMLQWRISENGNLTIEELNRLYPAMQFIAMIAKIKPEFIAKYDVKDYHISLLRRLYLDWENDEEDLITMAFKRPFGNSNVLGDVREEMMKSGDVAANQRYQDDEDDYSIETKVLADFVTILDKFYQEGFKLQISSFRQTKFNNHGREESYKAWLSYLPETPVRLHSYVYDWEPDISVIRDKKLETLINN